MEDAWRDQLVSQLYIEDKLVRLASHGLLKAVISQMEDFIQSPLTRNVLPDSVRVGRLRDVGEELGLSDDGAPCILNVDGTSVPVFPPDFDLTDYVRFFHMLWTAAPPTAPCCSS